MTVAESEFSLIECYFSHLTAERADVTLGIGDDCALLQCAEGKELAVSIDTLVEGVHFFADIDPHALGYKALAVNLSDLAAMGADPAWFTLALTLPENNPAWLEGFSSGLAAAAKASGIQLVGGDTTRGPLTISIQVHGLVDAGKALRRDGAKPGDKIYVTGTLGDAGAALKHCLEAWSPDILTDSDWDSFQQRLEYPTPRNALTDILYRFATSAIDISDGLVADLSHILNRSEVGAKLKVHDLPLSSSLKKLPKELATELALSSGDDYELCFTVPAELADELEQQCLDITCIGEITAQPGFTLVDASGQESTTNIRKGYDHFSA
jgi:thiamine-monophosphate kinase